MVYKILLACATLLSFGVIIGLSVVLTIARAADGYVAPQVALPFATYAGTPSGLTPPNDMMFATNMSPQDMRDVAFEWFDITPSARQALSQMPIYRVTGTDWAGIYDLQSRRVSINQPVFHVFLHEYGHANLHRKSFTEKVSFAVALLRLRWEPANEYAPYKRILEFVMAQAHKDPAAYNPVHEFYAYAAQYSGGDLDRIPGYLQSFFADYLSPGPNRWLQTQNETKAQQYVDLPGFRVMHLARP